MRYRLRTLLIVALIIPPMLAVAISSTLVMLRQKQSATLDRLWPGMMLMDPNSDAMIHIHSDGRPESGVPGLIHYLEDERPGIRESAAGWLKAIGGPAREALPELRTVEATDPDERVRSAAAEAIKTITSPNAK